MRASTSSTPFLKPSDTNDKHNYITNNITKVHFILFVHNLQFNDLIHWKDKPLKVATVFIHSGYSLLHGTFLTQ